MSYIYTVRCLRLPQIEKVGIHGPCSRHCASPQSALWGISKCRHEREMQETHMAWAEESLSPLGSRLLEAVLVSELALPPLVQRSPRTPFCYSQTAHSLAKKCWESTGCSGSHPDGSPMAGGLPGPLWQHAATHLTALTRCHRPSPKEPFTTMEATPLPKL